MSRRHGDMKVVLEGRGPCTLRKRDYIATGGEGSIYRKGKTSIKIYSDPQKMRRDGMADKLALLGAIDHEAIVAPEGLVTTPGGEAVGFHMAFAEGEPLTRVFTNDFRQRSGFTDRDAAVLAARMHKAVQQAHDAGAVMVDANELNWLAALNGGDGPAPRVIDVDSWAVGRWPATVVMPSIRDWHSPGFSRLSDWFAWGIVTFQLFTGIHPYKGRLDGYGPGELERRMRDNASVFAPGVRLNRAVRDFARLPGPLLDWYAATFQEGERSAPPSPYETGAARGSAARAMRVVTTAGSGLLSFERLLGETGDPALRIWPCGVVLLESGALIDLSMKRAFGRLESRDGEVVRVPGGWLLADRADGRPRFRFVNGTSLAAAPLAFALAPRRVLRCQDRLFAVTEDGLTELTLKVLGKPMLCPGRTWSVLAGATRWFDGVGIQDVMGAAFVVAPFGEGACAQVRVPELDGLTPVAARAGHRFIAVIGVDPAGAYRRLELTLDAAYRSYRVRQDGTDRPELNLAILPKGVCAAIADDGELTIFVPADGRMNRMQDRHIATDMALANWGERVVCLRDGEVWRLSN